MLGEWQNRGTVKEECQGRGECLIPVTSTLSLFEREPSIPSSVYPSHASIAICVNSVASF